MEKMSSSKIKEGLEGIADEVLDDVQEEAVILILQAEKEGKDLLKAAKSDSYKQYTKIMAEAVLKVDSEKRKVNSVADVEVRNRLLKKKEDLVELVFKKASLKLLEVVNTDNYFEYLLRLIKEASLQIGSKSMIVEVNSKDKAWLEQGNLERLSNNLKLNLRLAEETSSSIGGCKVQSIDGKLVYDNTLENRIQQLKPNLRLEIVKVLFLREESANVS